MTPRRFAAQAALSAILLVLASCSKPAAPEKRKEATPQAAAPAPSVATAPSGAPVPTSSVTKDISFPAPRCFSASDPHLAVAPVVQWTTQGEVSVVNVGADDVLNVRAQASPTAPVVTTLAFDARGIRATGQVCDVEKAYWYEIKAGAQRGWVNGKFLAPTLTPIDVTKEWAARIGTGDFGAPASLVEAVRAQLNSGKAQAEGKFETVLLGMAFKGSEAVVELRSCCALDDSVAGDQTTIRLQEDKDRWKLVRATKRTLCYRGSDAKGALCQ